MNKFEKKCFDFTNWVMNSESLKVLIVILFLLLAIFRTIFRGTIVYLNMIFDVFSTSFNGLDYVIAMSIPLLAFYLYFLFEKRNKEVEITN